jgi:hypothetical protein
VADTTLAIAGLRSALLTRHDDVTDIIRDRYQGFLASGPADWRIEIDCRPEQLPYSSAAVVRRDGAPTRFAANRRDFAGTVDLGRRRADVVVAEPDDVALNSFLRILYSLALVEARGLVVHAAGLIRNGRAYLFCGPSGSGKTTISRLSNDATLLSDELSIVRIVDRGALCFGTPFRGELGLAGSDRGEALAGIYFLRHGPRHATAPIKPSEALRRLLPNVLFFVKDGAVTATVFEIASTLVESVPCFELSFRPDPAFWEVIERG